MSGYPAAQLWFREEAVAQPNPNLVHAFIEGEAEALCGEARIIYYRCETFVVPPDGANVHEACREAVNKRNRE